MSHRLINHSDDLKRLRDEGYDIQVRNDVGYVLLKSVPYVAPDGSVKLGTLVSKLTLAGDVTTTPEDHVVLFSGELPCDQDGQPLTKIIDSTAHQVLAEALEVDHTFSSKPAGGYPDYHAKMTTYINMLLGPAHVLDPEATAQVYPVVEDDDEESVFRYIDTASSRAQIAVVTQKLALQRLAIVGLGGTGSYILDLVAKTPVREIHLFDGDEFSQHNAFRSPGAPSVETLRGKPTKVNYFADLYNRMRRGVIPHPEYLDDSNGDQLAAMDFVFLCLDAGEPKKLAVQTLEDAGVRFVDVGMGIYEKNGSLAGVVRVSTSTAEERAAARRQIPFSDGNLNNDYSQNIQIADLNALNAALAVIKWKKLFGFYVDFEREHNAFYTVDGNHLLNEDQSHAY